MTDPYSVLGVSPHASDEEIKKAYREQARKYHPDNYHDNPLADLAQEKMKAVNEAHDAILRMRSGGQTAGARHQTGGGYGGGNHAYSRGYGSGKYATVRAMIANGNFHQAEQTLNAATDRNAEWHFLMGSVCYRKGWLDQARQYIQQAVNLEPGNQEYQAALRQLSMGGFAYGSPHARGGNVGGCDCCDCCTALICMNCLCG